MKFLIPFLLAAPALADSLYFTPITTDVDGRQLTSAVFYQFYRAGKPYGAQLLSAPTAAAPYVVPSCEPDAYTVTAISAGRESKHSPVYSSSTCIPANPELEKIENAKLAACRADGAKLVLAKMAAEANLRACQARVTK